MKIEFDSSFLKAVNKIRDEKLLLKLEGIIEECESVSRVDEIRNCKKLSGFDTYFRIRLGDYRLGFEIINARTIRYITLAHRKEIYRNFP